MSSVWLEIADRVFVRRYEFFDQTIGVVIGRAGAVILDTRTTYRQADELRSDLRALSDVPAAAVVNTHHHYDHTFGNARFGRVPIWGHVRCAEVLVADGEAMRRRVMDGMPDLADEVADVAITPPDQAFAETARLDLDDRQITLRYLGRGHTDNDIVALVPDAGVLFAGDLLENDAPPSFGDSYPVAWAATINEMLLPLVAEVVVPGHGRPADRDFAQRQAQELQEVARLVRETAAGGMSREQAIAASPYPAETTRTAIDRGLLELKGG